MEKQKYHYIYKITFLCGEHKDCYYIGKRTTPNKTDNYYVGSGIFVKRYFKKYGKIAGETYIKEILEYNDSKEVNAEREKEIIGTLFKDDSKCMNLCEGGSGGKTYERTEIQKQHLSEIAKQRCANNPDWDGEMTEERRKHISEALKGKMAGENNPNFGNKWSDEQKSKQSAKMKGRKRVYNTDGTYKLVFV